nr:unnamed protein product [Spirometra erinaceieuropaei]
MQQRPPVWLIQGTGKPDSQRPPGWRQSIVSSNLHGVDDTPQIPELANTGSDRAGVATRGRRAIVRRSVSTTDLSSKATTDVAARPSRQVAASVSPKKQLRPDLPTERPHNAGNAVKHRRAAVRRSVSTSDLPSEAAADAAARPSRQMAASVSPKKQLRADQPVSRPHNTGAVKYLQTQLTGFTVHRTARQVAKDLQKQREADVVLSILNSEESGMKVIITDAKGRGVISTRTFFAGEFIVEYAGELISDSEARLREAEYKKNPNLGSFMFYFTHAGRRYCVDATEESPRLGRLINHSRLHPNCYVKVVPIDQQPRLALFAKTDIPPGEELLYDYGDRDKESLLSHPWLKY